MKASIVTFANLGKKQNLKTSDITPVIKTFSKAQALEQVICQINKSFYFQNTSSAIPSIVRYPLRSLEKIFHFSFSRQYMESLFDFFAAQKIKKADVVFFHAGYFLPKTVRVAKSNGSIAVDMAVSAHISVNADLEREEMSSLGFTKYQGLYMHLDKKHGVYTDFDYVIAMSDFVKNSYIQTGFPEEKIFLAAPDIDIERFSPRGLDKETFKILYVAHTQPLKGFHYLLDAWKELQLPDAELVVIGGFTDMPESLRKRYQDAIAADPRITWIPDTNEPEKYYHEATVFVFPSLTEGFGRVTLEAMACGIPVMTTENARGIVEEGKSGFVVPIRNADALAEKIEYLYHHRDEAAAMGREARLAVERKKPFGEAVYEIYQEILKREHTS